MSREERFERDLKQAIKWAASEHNYFLELSKDLAQLKQNILNAHTETTVSGIKQALRSFRYLSKSERRLNRYITDARKLSKSIKAKIVDPKLKEDFEDWYYRAGVEAADLIKEASRYDGELHDLLTHLEENLHEQHYDQAVQIIMQAHETIEHAEKWIAALSVDLNKAKSLAHEFSEVYHEDIEGVMHAISHLTPESKLNYLLDLLKHQKSLKKELIRIIYRLLETEVKYDLKKSYVNFNYFAEKCESVGAWQAAGIFWEKEYQRGKNINIRYHVSWTTEKEKIKARSLKGMIFCNEKCGLEMKSAKFCYRNEEYMLAAQQYIKSGLLQKALEAYKKLFETLPYPTGTNTWYFGFFNKIIKTAKMASKLAKKLNPPLAAYFTLQEVSLRLYHLTNGILVYRKKTHNIGWMLEYGPKSELRKSISLLRGLGYSKKEAHQKIAEITGNSTLAAQQYEKAGNYLEAAKRWKQAGNLPMSQKAMAKVTGIENTHEENLIAQAENYFKRGKFTDAISLFSKAEAWDRVGDCHNQLGQGHKAMKFYKKSVKTYREKYGFILADAIDLNVDVKLDVICQNIPKAKTSHELIRVLDDIFKLSNERSQASVIIHYLEKSKIVSSKHWRKLGEYFGSRLWNAASAEAFVRAGEAQDIQKAIRRYRMMQEHSLAELMALQKEVG